MTVNSLPRNVRNNNPLNLRRSAAKWRGRRKTVTDPAFEEFETMRDGMRAGLINMRTQINRRDNRCMPMSALIALWAPATDGNDPRNYAATVAKKTGVAPTYLLRFEDKRQICAVAWAMSQIEGTNNTTVEDWLAVYDAL